MNFTIATDVFRRRGWRARKELDVPLGADAYVVPQPAFVTGLRDWRRTPATSARQALTVPDLRAIRASCPQNADPVDGDWQPL